MYFSLLKNNWQMLLSFILMDRKNIRQWSEMSTNLLTNLWVCYMNSLWFTVIQWNSMKKKSELFLCVWLHLINKSYGKKWKLFQFFSRRTGDPGKNWFFPLKQQQWDLLCAEHGLGRRAGCQGWSVHWAKAVDMLEAQPSAQKENIHVTDLLQDSQGQSPILCFGDTDFWPPLQAAHLLKSMDHRSPCPSPPQTSASLMCH